MSVQANGRAAVAIVAAIASRRRDLRESAASMVSSFPYRTLSSKSFREPSEKVFIACVGDALRSAAMAQPGTYPKTRRCFTAVRPLIAVFGLALVSGCSAPHTDAAAAAATSTAPAPPGRTPLPSNEALIARAKALELDTPYVPPPGDPLEHNTSGYAKTMCSAVFITGLDPDVAAESVGYFTGPYEERAKVGTPVVDRAKKEVRITLPNGVVGRRAPLRIAGLHHAAARIADESFFTPVDVTPHLPDAEDDAVADGRRAAERSAAGRRSTPAKVDARGRRRIRTGRGADRRRSS